MPAFIAGAVLGWGLFAAPPAAEPAAPALEVRRSTVCTAISDRRPLWSGHEFKASVQTVYYWLDVRAGNLPASIRVLWFYEGKQASEIVLGVRHSKSRIWCHKRIRPGRWRVEARSPAGELLSFAEFRIS